MSEPQTQSNYVKRSVWLGLTAGWLAQLGLKTLLPTVVLVAVRFFSLQTENQSLWLEDPTDSSNPVWYALQAAVFLGSALAGWLAAALSPRRAVAVPAALVIMSLIATAFEQFPRPMSTTAIFVWAVGPCVGLLVGWLLMQLPARDDA